MEFSKFESKDHLSFSSSFSLKQTFTFAINKNPVFIASLIFLSKIFENIIFTCNFFLLLLNNNYLFEIIRFRKIRNYLDCNFFLLKKLRKNWIDLSFFLKKKFSIPFVISEIFVSIFKKTIFLSKFLIVLSFPFLIFFVNRRFVLKNEKNFLSFLLPENKKRLLSAQDQTSFFFTTKLGQNILNNSVIDFTDREIKNFDLSKQHSSWFFTEEISFFAFLSNFYQKKSLWVPLSLTRDFYEKTTKISSPFFLLKNSRNEKILNDSLNKFSKDRLMFSKWLSIYIKLKTDDAVNFSVWNPFDRTSSICKENKMDRKLVRKAQSSFDFLDFFGFFSSRRVFCTTTNLVPEGFLQKNDTFFFSLIEPKNLLLLKNLSESILVKKDSSVFDVLNFPNSVDSNGKSGNPNGNPFQKNRNWYHKKTIPTDGNVLQFLNQRHWILLVREWLKLYSSLDNPVSFLNQKQKVKEIFYSFQEIDCLNQFLKTPFSVWASVGQISFEHSLVKTINLSFPFVKKKQSFFLRSYKNAFEVPFPALDVFKYSTLNNLIFTFRNTINSLDFFPFSFERIEKINKKIDLFYNFSFHVTNKDYSIYSGLSNLIPTSENISCQASKNYSSFNNLQDAFLYDLDFYFKNNNIHNELYWNLNWLSQKDFLQEEHNRLFNSIKKSNIVFFQKEFKLIKKKRGKIQNLIQFPQRAIFKKYNDWFFTSYWWFFNKHRFVFEIQSMYEEFKNTAKITFHNLCIKNKNNNTKLFWSGHKINNFLNIIEFQFQKAKRLLVEQIYTPAEENLFWNNICLIKPTNHTIWGAFTWLITSCIVYYHWVSMLSGILYFSLWLNFEKVRSFSSPSWKTFLCIVTHNSFESPSQQFRLVGYLSRGTLFSIYSQFYKISNNFFFIFNKLNFITTVDLSSRQKNLVSNSLITKKTLDSRYSFWNINKEQTMLFPITTGSLDGFTFFEKWSERNRKICKFFPVFNSFSWNWLSDLFFFNSYSSSNFVTPFNSLSSNLKSKPIPLFDSVTYTQKWLFIGSLDSGKSFIIKNIAAGSSFPLIHISIQDIKNATPDSKYTKIGKQKRWAEQLSERSFFLDNIFNLAKMISPSIFWISDLHDFDTKNSTQEKSTQKLDLSLLLASLLKILSLNLVQEGKNNITFIGSTEYPRLLDPKFVSRQRLDLVVNFRTPSFNQRQNIFSSLLDTKGFSLKGLHCNYELTSNTLGYTFRDLTSLVNETLLIKTTEKTTRVDRDTIRLALYRQTSIQSVKYKGIKKENLSYKIGKALIQSILIYPKSMLLLSKYYDLWKTSFYYLSTTYLEISTKKGIITEFILLSQILNCLAGSAARDASTLSRKVFSGLAQSPFSLTSQLKHDFELASNILQSLVVEFSMQDSIFLTLDNKQTKEKILKNFHFSFQRKAMSYLEFLDQFPSYTNWSIRANRISFNWVLFFNQIEQSTKNLVESVFLDKSEKNGFSSILSINNGINFPYERRETRRQQQKLQKMDLFFNKLLYTFSIENLGFPWISNYVMNYTPFHFSLFFRETRPLWNPQNIMPSYSILFFDRDLLINQKLLTKLYITYGNKFQIEKLNRKRIKKQACWLNSSFHELDLKKNAEKKNDLENYQMYPDKTSSLDFHFYQNLINLNGQLDQSQIQLPVYFHQGWITADPAETNRIFDILIPPVLGNNEHLVATESFLYEILLEIYNYLIKFFLDRKTIVVKLDALLLKNEVLFREDIEALIKKN